jgi:hypothetical protein
MSHIGWSILLALLGCAGAPPRFGTPQPDAGTADRGPPAPAPLVEALVRLHGESQHGRAERGVRQVLAFWRPSDGDAQALETFVTSPPLSAEPLLRAAEEAVRPEEGSAGTPPR